MTKLGLLVNPVAGIGGRVGLRGSDGADTVRRALSLGAVPESGRKTLRALLRLRKIREKLDILTCPGAMGADVCREAGLSCSVAAPGTGELTTAEDTIRAARLLRDAGTELILFAGGDGTARNILDAVGTSVPVLGIPAGCKIHSAVYALTPEKAGLAASRYITASVKRTREAEVMDIDEELFRQNIVSARLYGYLAVPDGSGLIQNLKSGGARGARMSQQILAEYLVQTLEDDVLYIIGTGSTTAAVMERLGLPGTLLGVDLVFQKKLLAADCTEQQILRMMQEYERVKVLVTVIGGQGYVFGRGNQQISAEVLRRVRREDIIIAATPEKMLEFVGRPLYADTGDEELNRRLSGYVRVVTGYQNSVMMKLGC